MITRFGAGGEPPVALTIADYPPGSATDPRSEDAYLYGYVVEGSIEVELIDRTVVLQEGDSVAFDRGEAHAVRNPGPHPARAVWFAHRAMPSATPL